MVSQSLSLSVSNTYLNSLGSTIGSDTILTLQADSASIGGDLVATISDRGGTIGGNALLNFVVTHDITILGDAFWTILTKDAPDLGSPIGGTIDGNATLQLSAANLTAGSVFVNINNRNEGVSGPGGMIDSSANLTFNLSGNLTTQTDATFFILNGFDATTAVGGSGGTIVKMVFSNLTANNLRHRRCIGYFDRRRPAMQATLVAQSVAARALMCKRQPI